MKDSVNNINQWLFRGLVASIIILVGLMVIAVTESQYFAHQAQELIQVKQDYVSYTQALKRSIDRTQQANQEQIGQESISKKKKIDETDTFLVVNRNPEHLKQAALMFARQHQMERTIAPLYQSKEIDQSRLVRARSPRLRHITLSARRRARIKHLQIPEDVDTPTQERQFAWPLRHGSFRVGSPFGPRRRPNGTCGFHHGLDLPAAHGTLVMAAAHGVVIEAHYAAAFGNTILISHSNKLKTRYAHLSKIEVHVGDLVEQGQRIGRVGNTGNTRGRNGNHLHFEVLVYEKRVNPTYFLP